MENVLRRVWSEENAQPPSDLAWLGERYERAVSVWIVAYHRRRPVGVMALCDPRIASLGLDCWRRRLPPGAPPERTREIARLGIVREHRGRGQLVMVGLLRELPEWSRREGIEQLLAASIPALFEAYRRFNPTAKLLDWPTVEDEDPALTRYFASVRAWGGTGVVYTFEVRGASPWNVVSTCFRGKGNSRPEIAAHGVVSHAPRRRGVPCAVPWARPGCSAGAPRFPGSAPPSACASAPQRPPRHGRRRPAAPPEGEWGVASLA